MDYVEWRMRRIKSEYYHPFQVCYALSCIIKFFWSCYIIEADESRCLFVCSDLSYNNFTIGNSGLSVCQQRSVLRISSKHVFVHMHAWAYSINFTHVIFHRNLFASSTIDNNSWVSTSSIKNMHKKLLTFWCIALIYINTNPFFMLH